jgi:hypothetical protein
MKTTILMGLIGLTALFAYAEDEDPKGQTPEKPKTETPKPKTEKPAKSEEKKPPTTNVPKVPKAAAFKLPGLDGKDYELKQYKGKWVVLEWSNYGCPFVVAHYTSGNIQKMQKDYMAKGVVWLTICSTAKAHKDYRSPKSLAKSNATYGATPTATLLDTLGHVGTIYKARTTPHMYVINPKGEVVYQGAIDNYRETKEKDVKKRLSFLRQVLNAALAGKPIPFSEKAPYGCSVKYARPRTMQR